MVRVYYTKVSSFMKADTFWFQLHIFGEERRRKIMCMANDKDKLRSFTAGILLHYALCKKKGLPLDCKTPFKVSCEAGGKPFLTEFPEIYFNLSHSGDYVCCAIGDEPVGTDIQKHTEVKERLAERFFTEQDNHMLAACNKEQREKLFFRMWSIKESYIKLTGKGISQGLDSFEIIWEREAVMQKEGKEPDAFFKESDSPSGYSLCVCFRSTGQEVIWQEVCREELSRIFGN